METMNCNTTGAEIFELPHTRQGLYMIITKVLCALLFLVEKALTTFIDGNYYFN